MTFDEWYWEDGWNTTIENQEDLERYSKRIWNAAIASSLAALDAAAEAAQYKVDPYVDNAEVLKKLLTS